MKQHIFRVLALPLIDGIATVVMISAMVLACTLPFAKAAFGATPEEAGSPNLLFCYLDADRDGVITLSEARRLRGFEQVFLQADANRDGRLSRDEFARAQVLFDQAMAAANAGDGALTVKVRNALVGNEDLRAARILVETYGGQVILGGKVDTPARARKAIDLVNGVPGVESVKTTLEIGSRI